MALTTIEGRYIDGKIKLKEHPRDIEAARVFVTFVEDETDQAQQEQERKESIARMVATMRAGISSLSGGPYYTNRKELYEDRMAQLERRSD